jgi:hypothetical protein
VQFSNLTLNLNVDPTGKPTTAEVTTTVDESAVGDCIYGPGPGTSTHAYHFDSATTGADGSATVMLSPDPTNDIKAKLVITGQFGGTEKSIPAKLHWERTDTQISELVWKVDASVTCSR